MSVKTDLETRLQVLNEVLERAESETGFQPGKEYREVFRAYVAGVQAWARVKDLVDAARIREEVRREVLAAFGEALEGLPPDQATQVRLRLIQASERAA